MDAETSEAVASAARETAAEYREELARTPDASEFVGNMIEALARGWEAFADKVEEKS